MKLRTLSGLLLSISLAAFSHPAFAAEKVTVAQLTEILAGMQKANKSDQDVANRISQIELSEELTLSARDSLAPYLPGQLSTEQVYILEARSATLPPASTPATAAPDAAAQQALLAKTQASTATYAQLGSVTATRMTARFQDLNITPPSSGGGLASSFGTNTDPITLTLAQNARLTAMKTDEIRIENGADHGPAAKDKTQWGANGMVASINDPLSLPTVIQEAIASGAPRFERWQTIGSHTAAVFSFAVDRKKTKFQLRYCCFPDTDTVGTTHINSPTSGNLSGNVQNNTQWHDFKASPGYQGKLFLDPDSGAVLRLITESHLKPSEFVQYEAVRTDFEPRTVGSKTAYLPIRTFILTTLVPNGDSKASHVAIRHQFVTEDYKDFQPAGAAK